MTWLDRIPWIIVIGACLTLGLAPFRPPHVWEKLLMLTEGTLRRPVDIFDFVMHGAPWLVLLLKLAVLLRGGVAKGS